MRLSALLVLFLALEPAVFAAGGAAEQKSSSWGSTGLESVLSKMSAHEQTAVEHYLDGELGSVDLREALSATSIEPEESREQISRIAEKLIGGDGRTKAERLVGLSMVLSSPSLAGRFTHRDAESVLLDGQSYFGKGGNWPDLGRHMLEIAQQLWDRPVAADASRAVAASAMGATLRSSGLGRADLEAPASQARLVEQNVTRHLAARNPAAEIVIEDLLRSPEQPFRSLAKLIENRITGADILTAFFDLAGGNMLTFQKMLFDGGLREAVQDWYADGLHGQKWIDVSSWRYLETAELLEKYRGKTVGIQFQPTTKLARVGGLFSVAVPRPAEVVHAQVAAVDKNSLKVLLRGQDGSEKQHLIVNIEAVQVPRGKPKAK